jgi:ParB/Sulfiredoxin domain
MTANQVGLAMLPTDAIRPNPRNVRSEVGDITELAASIRAEGILQPLSVEPAEDSTYTLLWGNAATQPCNGSASQQCRASSGNLPAIAAPLPVWSSKTSTERTCHPSTRPAPTRPCSTTA